MDSQNDILRDKKNRQYPIPDSPWLHYQEWHETLFLHWEVDVKWVERFIPPELRVDTIDGRTWLSIVAFTVKDLRLRYLPPPPYVSNFHEVNLRVYVTRNGVPGIYFLSIEAEKFLPAFFARLILGLPYSKAQITRRPAKYYSHTATKNNLFDVTYIQDKLINDKSALDLWLTERHSLYQERGRKLYRLDIHHKEWQLNTMSVTSNKIKYGIIDNNMFEDPPQLCHYSEGVDVLLWEPRLVT